MKARPAHLIVGEIKKPHGIKGELFVLPATDDVALVYEPGRTLTVGDADGGALGPDVTLTVAVAREFKGGLIIRFDGLIDRNSADQFRGRTLLIRAEDTRPLEQGEYFLHDLAGLEVTLLNGEVVGRVAEIYEGATDYLLGVDDGERERLIPFSGQIVREVDLVAGRIVIEPTPGMLTL